MRNAIPDDDKLNHHKFKKIRTSKENINSSLKNLPCELPWGHEKMSIGNNHWFYHRWLEEIQYSAADYHCYVDDKRCSKCTVKMKHELNNVSPFGMRLISDLIGSENVKTLISSKSHPFFHHLILCYIKNSKLQNDSNII